jgi:hypothetical protein
MHNRRRLLAAACVAALAGAAPALTFATTGTVTVSSNEAGKTLEHVGYNMGHYLPGSNTSAWVDHSGVNAFRVWAAASEYEVRAPGATNRDDLAPWGDGVNDLAGFNARKAALRGDPLNESFIDWPEFNNRFQNHTQGGRNDVKLNYILGEMHDRGIHVMQQTTRTPAAGPIASETDWGGKWEQWQHYYAMAFHSARHYDVAQFQMYNEPDGDTTITQAQWITRLKLASDAIRSAVSDVNRIYGKHLVADVAAPVSAGGASKAATWGAAALAEIRTDYQGQTVNYDIFNTYAAQVYEQTGAEFGGQVQGIKAEIVKHHRGGDAAGAAMPVMFSEFNRHGSNHFADADLADVDLNTPYVFTDIGSTYLNAMAQGTKAMYAFKFSQTEWVPRQDPGEPAQTVQPQKTGFHYVSNAGNKDITGATKAASVVRLTAKAFKGERPRLATGGDAVGTYDVGTSFDAESGNYYLMGINRHTTQGHDLTVDLTGWDVQPGTVISVEEVSSKHHGEVTRLITVPQNKRLTLANQPSQSVWLLTAPSGTPLNQVVLNPTDDARVRNSDASSPEAYRTKNYGTLDRAMVGRTPDSARFDTATYLQFDTGDFAANDVSRAILQLTGRSVSDTGGDPGSILYHVYALAGDGWDESTITWDTAPNLADAPLGLPSDDTRLAEVGTSAFPVGHLTFDSAVNEWGVDVTEFLRQHPGLFDDGSLSFALVREERFANDADASLSYVELWTKESGALTAPKLTLSVVPEPGSLCIAGGAGLALLMRRRRA